MQESFSYKIKNELTAHPEKKPCCRRAFFYGLLYAAEVQEDCISVVFLHPDVSELFGALAKDCIKRESQVKEKIEFGRKKWVHTVSAKRVAAYLKALDSDDPVQLSELAELRCDGCWRCFLRGVFLAMGTVTDPEKAIHAEFLMSNAKRIDRLDEFLATHGFPAKKVVRGKRIGLYYKRNEEVEELFTVMGAVHAALDMINLIIEKGIRNNENRATNCVARNIARTVDAVARQITAVEKLRDHGILESLPDDLRITGELRLKYDEASLSELASYHLPPISKSGLNHRLSRLMEMAEKLK